MTQITRFTIERFRQFDEAVSIDLDPITALIGANNSGKTAARGLLQESGIPAQSLAHKNIIDVLTVPKDVVRLLNALARLARHDQGGTANGRSGARRRTK